MKKFLSLFMMLTMVLSLSFAAFAADDTGSITITNATLGEDYHAYKIFNAAYIFDEDGGKFSYTIDPDNQFYSILFDEDGNPTADNKCFVLNPNTNSVSKAEGVNDSELTAYLLKLVNDENNTFVPDASATDVTSDVVTFDDLAYGYYVIKATLSATVTINSYTPDATVIDKSQIPGNDSDKTGQTEIDTESSPIYTDSEAVTETVTDFGKVTEDKSPDKDDDSSDSTDSGDGISLGTIIAIVAVAVVVAVVASVIITLVIVKKKKQ